MPDRLIRDELLDSERYCNLSSDTARLAFIHCILQADDLGNLDGSAFFMRRRVLFSNASDEAVAKILSELCDADLIRVYSEGEKRFLHIPRFRQRLRYINSRIPRPPKSIECKEINGLVGNKSDLSLTQVSLKSDSSQQKRREEKRREENKGSAQGAESLTSAGAEVPISQVLRLWSERLPHLVQPRTVTTKRRDAFKRIWHLVASQPTEDGGKRSREQMLEYFSGLFAYIASIPFLMGHNDRGWQMDFDWLCNQNNFVKVIEGKYDTREVKQ